MLEVADLAHGFTADQLVLDLARIEITDGEFVSIVGPSGCGKSTLLRLLAGLIEPLRGTITMDGSVLPDRPGFAGFMPQHDRLLAWRRALDNAAIASDVQGHDRAASRRRAAELFTRFGLGGYERAWPAQLSGGMRQRLALLRTFLTDQKLLLLDEPFGALDAITRRQMHTWLGEVLEIDPRTVVFVTHDIDEALLLSDRVLVLSPRPGRVVAEIVVSEPRPRPAASVTSPAFVAMKIRALDALELACDPETIRHTAPGGGKTLR